MKDKTIDQVYCIKCRDYHNVCDVEHIRIEEEYQGYDSLFYKCPVSNETVSSVIHKGIVNDKQN